MKKSTKVMKPMKVRQAVGKAIGKVAGKKAEYKFTTKKADYVTKSGKVYKAVKKKKG